MRRSEGIQRLLDAADQNTIALTEIDASHRAQLLDQSDRRLRERAQQLFSEDANANRRRVVDTFLPALQLASDRVRGSQLFRKHCSSCHRLDDFGQEVGPDLAAVQERAPKSLLISILDPSRSIESKYQNYVAVTDSGVMQTGILTSETNRTITLLTAQAERVTIPRRELESLATSSRSLMPDGFERDITAQDLADIIAYLRRSITANGISNEKIVREIHPSGNGSFLLRSTTCEIYGDNLVLNNESQRLDGWRSASDRAVWPIVVTRGGTYVVWLRGATGGDDALNNIHIECGGAILQTDQADASKEGDDESCLGIIELPGGAQRFTVGIAAIPNGSDFTFESIHLRPQQAARKQ